MAILFVMPLFFSSNIVFGRAAVSDVEPFTLAFIRWTLTALILFFIVWPALSKNIAAIRSLAMPFLLMGFFGMWICGALVYLALKYTTATNGTLIYTSSPVMIILIEWWFRGRKAGWREGLGVLIALLGVVVIVTKASWSVLFDLKFNIGDLIFVITAVSWSIYSVGLKSEKFSSFEMLPLFALIAACGALLLAPFAFAEMILLQAFPSTKTAWFNIAGIVVIASLLAFSSFNHGVKVIGASLASVFMYLLPVYGVTLAVLFLGEELHSYHLWGIVLVLSGVILATAPISGRRRT